MGYGTLDFSIPLLPQSFLHSFFPHYTNCFALNTCV